MSIYAIKGTDFRFIEKRFWFGYFEQKELVCSRCNGKCYWKIVYHDYGFTCRDEIPLTKEEARKLLKEYKEIKNRRKVD